MFALVKEIGTAKSHDVVADFRHGADKIDLSGIDADTARNGDQAFRFIDEHAFGHHARELRYKGGLLSADVDGDGKADFVLEIANHAHLSGV